MNRYKQSKLPQTKAKWVENVKFNEETGPVKGTSWKRKNNVLWHTVFPATPQLTERLIWTEEATSQLLLAQVTQAHCVRHTSKHGSHDGKGNGNVAKQKF